MTVEERDFPLFPLPLVALPGEAVPLHIFEQRYRTMIGRCLDRETPFGIIWLADDGLREIGCACGVEQLLERGADGSFDILARGERVIRVLERQRHLPYPAGVIEFPEDVDEPLDPDVATETRRRYRELINHASERDLSESDVSELTAYAMAATVDFGLEVKQTLLELRSENARLALVLRLFRAALKRLEFVDRAQTRARSNGKVRF